MNRRECRDNLVKPQTVAYNCGKAAMASAIPHGNAHGVVLLITMILLVMLSVTGYILTIRIAAQRHRYQYAIDYQNACYACQSGLKYAYASLNDINVPDVISRPNEPDFSDLFALSEKEYKKVFADWAAQSTAEARKKLAAKKGGPNEDMFKKISDDMDVNSAGDLNDLSSLSLAGSLSDNSNTKKKPDIDNSGTAEDVNDANSAGDVNDVNKPGGVPDYNDPNMLTIPGPYGPPWPYVVEPVEFEIGSSRIRIEIEDENAKYPLTWALLDSNDTQPSASSGLELFCEWMKFDYAEIKSLKEQLKEIGKIKKFSPGAGTVTVAEKRPSPVRSGGRIRRPRGESGQVTLPPSSQTADFAKLFHSSLLDADTLSRPTVVSETRKESALKYMGTWASDKVNINTAPRHVLEAAFAFGGDEVDITKKIIERRREQPFKDIEDLRKTLFRYVTSIDKCKQYITTSSNFFTIKITAISGTARVSAVMAIIKDKKRAERIAVIFG